MAGIRGVAVIVGIAAMLAGCGGTHGSSRHDPGGTTTSPIRTGTIAASTGAATPHPQLGPFAGYMWNGDVESVHADWNVPRLLPGSARGEAATWIGAEAPGPAQGAPFIQVGVNEGNTGGTPFYYAFYSTTKLHFHPVELFGVAPGDEVSATLSRHGALWEIEFVDRVGRERRLSVVEGAGHRFNEAQYTQEDVTDARTGRPFPYPSLSPIRFTAVAANGVTPRPSRLNTSWLTEADGYLAPGPLLGGGFTLGQAQMTAADYRYLRAIAIQDDAMAMTTEQVLRWARGGPAPGAGVAARRFVGLLRTTISALGGPRWPAAARGTVSALRSHARRMIALLSMVPRVTVVGRTAWALQFERLSDMVGAGGQAARRALGLPGRAVQAAG